MKSRWSPVLLTILALIPLQSRSLALQTGNDDRLPLVILRGRVSCVTGETTQETRAQQTGALLAVNDCSTAGTRYELSMSSGVVYSCSPADAMTAMFSDPRIRERELQVTARANASNELEIIKIRAVRDGKLYDVFYFCDVCNITAYAPGPCACCRREYELKEVPAQISDLGLRDAESAKDHPSPQT
ncbi:MAG TPA: hypothetical protein VJH03_14870 [Blastocatellia bacterium]|nr:hypothetical protein [Blastocatellia bacterium]